ncbi:kinesin light chain-like [Toxorhynchites rutilus septentrionalis]|uniref:kinesin light chain-like n=1 Tax=Toxorhynchites rutilus septentrionalis TaxID=329112 RepID=UPI002479A34D|nr:kinesin light chain-like [Toxorhynchites rutilus septentrionalis]
MEDSAMSPRQNHGGLETQARAILRNLQITHAEHLARASNLFDSDGRDSERNEILKKNIETVSSGIAEAQSIVVLSSFAQICELEQKKLQTRIGRLREENAWLRSEVTGAQQKLIKANQTIAQLEEEKKHLEFMASLKTYEVGEASSEPKVESLQEVQELFASIECTSSHVAYRPRTLHTLLIHFASQRRYEVAVPLCNQALVEIEKTRGRDNPDYATMCNILALMYRDQNKYIEATRLLRDALVIRKKTLGENHPAVAATLNNLVVLYGMCGKHEAAEPFGKEALKIRENALGKDHPDVAKQLNNLALVCQNLNKYSEAEKYYVRATKIYEDQFGVDDPNVGKTKNNLAGCFIKQGRYKAAEFLYKQVLTRAHEKQYGAISQVNKSIWQIAENREMLKIEDAGSIRWSKGEGVDSAVTIATLKNLACLYRKQGKHIAANTLGYCVLRSKVGAINASPKYISKKEEESYKKKEK